MKVIIAGSRNITDYYDVFDAVLFSKFDITEVVSGGAKGVDRLGEEFAQEQFYDIKQFLPDWERLGKRAGFVRNVQMAEYADALIAIWDGKSRGTKHMIDTMEKMKKPVYIHLVPK